MRFERWLVTIPLKLRSLFLRRLVVLQVALSVVLLVGAGLFARTFRNLRRVDAGFNADVLIVRLDPRAAGYSTTQLPNM